MTEGLQPPYLTIEELVNLIDKPNHSVCVTILEDNRELFQLAPGSSHNHQAWPGGYIDHVHETMNQAVFFYPFFNSLRPLPFTVSDALLVLFLHDIEKPWKYEVGEDGKLQYIQELRSKEAQHLFRAKKLTEYGIILSLEQENGMKYVEGEFADYRSDQRVMHPLAAFCHICDVTSARIWPEHPVQDPWRGAQRFRLNKGVTGTWE